MAAYGDQGQEGRELNHSGPAPRPPTGHRKGGPESLQRKAEKPSRCLGQCSGGGSIASLKVLRVACLQARAARTPGPPIKRPSWVEVSDGTSLAHRDD